MTGYARGEGHDAAVSWVWEAKSVNGKGLDMRIRVPAGYDSLEMPARETLTKAMKRGNLQVSLTVTSQTQGAQIAVNDALLERMLSICSQWQDRFPGVAAAPTWDGLLALRGVLEVAEPSAQDENIEDRTKAMLATLESAVVALIEMRQTEGGRIGQVLNGQLTHIAELKAKAAGAASLRPEAMRERLKAQLAAIMDVGTPLSEDRLAQEIALLAVKADIREELDRLDSHVAAARELLTSGGAVGRKLDFLAQEFNREANTLCSKSQDVDLTRIGLELKLVIDQFREQVQNIE